MCKDGELGSEAFDFAKHVDLSPEAISAIQVHSLTEMGYELQPGQLDFGYCEPFRFLTSQGLKLYRESLTSPKVTANCYYSCEKVPLTVRNATAHSTFLYEMSTDSSLLGALQKLMNCGDLLQWHPFQLEQMMTNIQQTGGESGSKQAFKWHNDSNDFVLLVQVSDIPADARGGGTLMMSKDGSIREVRAPGAGYAYLMQGKVVVHAGNGSENWIRSISVISFVSKASLAPECLEPDTVNLTLAKNYTQHGLLDKEYGTYRLKNCKEKLDFLMQNFYGESDFESKERRAELLLHLDHLIKNLQITRDSLQMLNDWSEAIPRPLPPESVTDLGFAKVRGEPGRI
mmetsp:Transcript_15616/g.26562  ORF Transcript_15616/g.26562 Transcript_15616/m.26562 type:complete len:343 (+) Transcript_15616:105-1133(+)